MVVRYFHIVSIVIAPDEANPVLVVETYAVLPLPISAQFLQAITGRMHEIGQFHCRVKHPELSSGDVGGGSPSGFAGPPDFPGRPVGKTPDHCSILTVVVNNVKHY